MKHECASSLDVFISNFLLKNLMQSVPTTSSLSPSRSWAKRLSELKACPWYWGDLSWRTAEKLLLLCENGSFLVRDSHSDNHLFTVSYRHGDRVYHSRVEISGQFVHLGGPSSLERSESVVDLLKHAVQISYSHERDILMHRRGGEAEASEIQLRYPLSRLALLPRLQYLCRLRIRLLTDPKFLIPNIKECMKVLEIRRDMSCLNK